MIEPGQSLGLMVFGLSATVSWRLMYVWVYNNTGKTVFAAITGHALGNISRDASPVAATVSSLTTRLSATRS